MMPAKNRFRRMFIRRAAIALAIVAGVVTPSTARADENDKDVRVLFTQQDVVQAFSLATGSGFQTGTAVGQISGTTSVEFQFFPTGAPVGDVLPIGFHNKVIITDIDGDQIFFDNDGTGSFHLGVPGVPFVGTGGPLRGAYVVTGATGKFSDWKVGTKFTYKAVASNPPNGALGNVYVEVTYRERDKP